MSHTAPVIQAFSDNGNGTGTVNMIGNYSVTDKLFYVQPDPGVIYHMYQFRIVIADNAALNLLDYGNISNGLTNGIKIESKLGGVVRDSLEGFRIKQNWHWLGIGNSSITEFSGVPQALITETVFPEFYGSVLELNGTNGDYLGFRLNDDFSSLVGHIAWARIAFGL